MNPANLKRIIQTAFPNIPDPELAELISIGIVRSYPAKRILCRKGEVESVFYIILEGEVHVQKTINESDARFLKPLGPGDFFGEYALIHDAPRSATVVTSQPTRVLEIRKAGFNRLLKRSAALSLAIMTEVSRRLRENDQMAIEDLRLKAFELADAYQRLAELEFLRREFLTTVAHELRTPLTAANGFLQALKIGMVDSNEIPAVIEMVDKNVQKIASLVNNILFLQELDLILEEAAPVEIGPLVERIVFKHREPADANQVQIEVLLPEIPVYILGDEASIEKAISAILDNAIKFSPDGGRVLVAVSLDETKARIQIRDQGVGIPAEALPQIFDRYYHMEKVGDHLFGGMGLGLAIARQVIFQHGGRVLVESELGRGSQFTIELNAELERVT